MFHAGSLMRMFLKTFNVKVKGSMDNNSTGWWGDRKLSTSLRQSRLSLSLSLSLFLSLSLSVPFPRDGDVWMKLDLYEIWCTLFGILKDEIVEWKFYFVVSWNLIQKFKNYIHNLDHGIVLNLMQIATECWKFEYNLIWLYVYEETRNKKPNHAYHSSKPVENVSLRF